MEQVKQMFVQHPGLIGIFLYAGVWYMVTGMIMWPDVRDKLKSRWKR